jgi:hypothetical protein
MAYRRPPFLGHAVTAKIAHLIQRSGLSQSPREFSLVRFCADDIERRERGTSHATRWLAFEKRQGTKSREVARRSGSERCGEFNAGADLGGTRAVNARQGACLPRWYMAFERGHGVHQRVMDSIGSRGGQSASQRHPALDWSLGSCPRAAGRSAATSCSWPGSDDMIVVANVSS